jgi:hypothetical protein
MLALVPAFERIFRDMNLDDPTISSAPVPGTNAGPTSLRVAVVFFGITRSIQLSIESIRQKIYACNAARGVSFYTLASLNVLQTLNNPRAGEIEISQNLNDVFLLNADFYALVCQDDTTISAALRAAQQQVDPFENGWSSIRNLLHQLSSLYRAWRICNDVLAGGFDYYLFVRPDQIYLDELPLEDLVSAFRGEGNIALPAWQCWGGFNDRIALADATAARYYAERLLRVQEYCSKLPLHSERLLAYALDKGACKVSRLPMRARRVRANGMVVPESFAISIVEIPPTPQRFRISSNGVSFD